MPGFGEGSVFGQAQPTDLASMLQAAFPAAPMLDYMAIPQAQQQQQQPIELSGVTQKPNALTAFGGGLQGASQLIGSAMAARDAAKSDLNPNAYQSPGSNPLIEMPIKRMPMLPTQDLSGLQYNPIATKNPFGG